jgi:hypothetical protein
VIVENPSIGLYETAATAGPANQLRITIRSALNRGPDEWLATFADPVRAQSAIDRFTSNAFDLVIEGESYRSRLKPTRPARQKTA